MNVGQEYSSIVFGFHSNYLTLLVLQYYDSG